MSVTDTVSCKKKYPCPVIFDFVFFFCILVRYKSRGTNFSVVNIKVSTWPSPINLRKVYLAALSQGFGEIQLFAAATAVSLLDLCCIPDREIEFIYLFILPIFFAEYLNSVALVVEHM